MHGATRGMMILIHGAWLGGWSWRPVARELVADGFTVRTPTLPGLGYDDPPADVRLDDAVTSLVDDIVGQDLHDVTLVCHSWGGYPATGAAHRTDGRVRRVVYYNAVVPVAGVSMADENDQYGRLIRQAVTASPDRTVPIDLESVRHAMMADESEALQRLVFSMMVPQPGAYMLDHLSEGPVTEAGIGGAYLGGVADAALARPAAEFAARLGVEVTSVPGTHLTMVTRPAEIAPAIIAASARPGS